LVDARIDAVFERATTDALPTHSSGVPLYDLLRYHLGYLNVDLKPERVDPGKRMRSKLCAFSCLAAGGALERAAPVAAAIELLHNFTLIHDDIQDRSELRRHRPTLWSRWGESQAINAGDALFVLAHLALNGLIDEGVSPETVLALSDAMHRMTLRIVEGQVLDLSFEQRDDVLAAEYLEMIGGKTAAICQFAAWAGAIVGGADQVKAELYGAFGQALGLGFQLRDDALGVWGATAQTGKDAGDIRRKKKSYPVLLLFERTVSDYSISTRALSLTMSRLPRCSICLTNTRCASPRWARCGVGTTSPSKRSSGPIRFRLATRCCSA
jgi:geranylgeranyl diphosphate synthase type I